MQQNGTTPKWVAIIVAIFLAIVGGMFAWTQAAVASNSTRIMETREMIADVRAEMREMMAEIRADVRYIRNTIGERNVGMGD